MPRGRQPSVDSPLDLPRLMRAAVGEALRDEDPARLVDWMRAHIGEYLSAPTGPQGDPLAASPLVAGTSAAEALAAHLGRAIWNALPLPGNRFRPRPLPSPGRNDPCVCGSGRKYKQCCGQFPSFPTLDPLALWPFVLDRVPADVVAQAVDRGEVPVAAIGAVAEQRRDDGDPRKAAALLEPLFQGRPRDSGKSAEQALDLLCDVYDDLGHTRKKRELLERVVASSGRSPLRSGAWQRLATIRMDDGQSASAWEAFQAAQRDDPDSPSIALLEVHLLIAERRFAEARDRARFWLKRLSRSPRVEHENLLRFLETVAEDPVGALGSFGLAATEGAGEGLRDWLDEVRDRPLPAYRAGATPEASAAPAGIRAALRDRFRGMGVAGEHVERAVEQALTQFGAQRAPREAEPPEGPAAEEGPEPLFLEAPAALLAAEEDWRQVFPVEKPFSVQNLPLGGADPWEPAIEEAWAGWLESHPEAFDSLEILDDLATALHQHPQFGASWLDRDLLEPVLLRAEAIVEAALAGVAEPRLEWAATENRLGLRSLVRLYWMRQRTRDTAGAAALADRLLALNPNDNHGLRAEVMNRYLRQAHEEQALALAARYPGDLTVELSYGRVLALFRLARLEEAKRALEEALRGSPKIPRYLTAAQVRKPHIDPHQVRLGGDDEAWLYREAMREVWQATPGALAWLKQTEKALGGGR